jgi:hypothetical protein
MTVGKGKRPRDPNQLAKGIVDRSAAEPTEEIIVPKTLAPPITQEWFWTKCGLTSDHLTLEDAHGELNQRNTPESSR